MLTGVKYNDGLQPVSDSELLTSPDPVLTALAQLGASKLKTSRALISLFDEDYQYIVAEATPTLPLVPSLAHKDRQEELWLCGTAIARSQGVCEYTLCGLDPTQFQGGDDRGELPLALVADLVNDSRFSSKPFCQPGSPARFYAAVPIRTPKGINIGVFCVIDTVPGIPDSWDDGASRLMREISRTIMEHLDCHSTRDITRRNERMARGLGSFMEGKSTLSGWRVGSGGASFEDRHGFEGSLNAKQQTMGRKVENSALQVPISARPAGKPLSFPSTAASGHKANHPAARERELAHVVSRNSSPTSAGSVKSRTAAESASAVFSKAANITRESIEVEGVIFLDATPSSFGGLASQFDSDDENRARSHSSEPTSSDDGTSKIWQSNEREAICRVLGFSTSDSSSIDGARRTPAQGRLQEAFLSTLLRRYPRGKIFNFDKNGGLLSGDSSEDASASAMPSAPAASSPATAAEAKEASGARAKRRRKPFARRHEGSIISEAFPGARSVAFVPVWNSRNDRWFAGGFAYTYATTRIFTIEGELSYLMAFGTLAMAETYRNEKSAVEKAKMDVLSSLSHELRSPLHGVVLSIELLQDTHLDVFQENVLYTLETCSRTLVDTIDHLLDYSKINKYATTIRKQSTIGPRGLKQERSVSIEDGMKSLHSDVQLDAICEDVMESVFAGFSMQHGPTSPISRSSPASPNPPAPRPIQGEPATASAPPNLTRTTGQHDEPLSPTDGGEALVEPVSIFLDIDPTCSWAFHSQPGAIRRIVMNLFGNSLKYTRRGTIGLSLEQGVPDKRLPDGPRIIKLAMADTGKGISEDYLQHELFSPFTQEDPLAPGTGLGLSLVKKIVSQLHGSISVDSRVGVGTTVSVSLPLAPSPLQHSPDTGAATVDEDQLFRERVSELRGLRVRLLGFDGIGPHGPISSRVGFRRSHKAVVEKVCRGWLCMEVIAESSPAQLVPDLIFCTEDTMAKLPVENGVASGPPTVVVCPSALAAHRLSASQEWIERPGVFEFISQP